MLTKGAIGNLINRYRAVLTKCTLINTFGSLAVASMLVLGGAGMAVAADTVSVEKITSELSGTPWVGKFLRGYENYTADDAQVSIDDANIVVKYTGTQAFVQNDTWVEGIRTNNGDFTFNSVNVTVVNDSAAGSATYKSECVDKPLYSTGIYATNNDNTIASDFIVKGDATVNVATNGLRAVGIKTSSPMLTVKGVTTVNVTSAAGDTYGIATQYTGSFVADKAVNVTATAKEGEARGISVQPYSGNTGNLDLNGDVTVVAEGEKALGVRAFGTKKAGDTDGNVNIGEADSVISISAKSTTDGAFGMAVEEGAVLDLKGKEATISAESESGRVAGLLLFGVQTDAEQANAPTSTIDAPLTVIAKGGEGNTTFVDGIRINEMYVDFKNTVNVDVDNAGTGQTVGVFVTNNGTGSKERVTTFDKGATVDVKTDKANTYGMVVSAGNSAVDVDGGHLQVDATSTDGFVAAVVAQGISDTAKLSTADDSTAEFNATSTTGKAVGLWANGATTVLEGDTVINAVGGAGATGILVEEEDSKKGTATFTGDLTVNAKTAASVKTNGELGINNTDTDATVQLTGDVENDGGTANIKLTNAESFLKGAVNDISSGKTSLGLTNGAEWVATKDSSLDTLTLDGGTLTVLSDVKVTANNSTGSSQNEAVSGNVNMALDAEGVNLGNVTTDAEVNVTAADAEGNTLTADDVTADQLNTLRGKVTSGSQGTTGSNLTVTASAEEGFVFDAIKVDENGNPTGGGASPVLEAVNEMASFSTVSLDRILTNDVRKRLGDIRSDKNQTGVWMRWDGGKLKGNSGLTTDFNAVQIGADSKFGFTNTRFGVAASFIHGDSDHKRVNADLEGFSFAAYGTWMGDNGMFADVVARVSSMDNEMQAKGEEAKLDSIVSSLSGEFGWRFDLCQQFYVEPQVELAYTYVKSDDLQFSTARFDIADVDSLIGRLGMAAGWKLPNDLGDVYARASVVQQFLGDAKISTTSGAGSYVYETDGEDTWLEYGLGANIKLTDSTYLWADVERTEGAEIDEEWRGTVGVRFSF